jgi:hypothetical protein
MFVFELGFPEQNDAFSCFCACFKKDFEYLIGGLAFTGEVVF